MQGAEKVASHEFLLGKERATWVASKCFQMTPQKDHIERESFPNYNEPSVSQRDGNVLRLLKSARNMRIQLSSMDDDEGPAGLCKRGSCRHSSLVPIYKSPKFKQTAAGQAPTMLSGGKRGARLELPAQQ